MKLAGRNHVLPHMTLTEAIRFMQDVGYDAIELSALRGQSGVFPEVTEDYVIRHILECVKQKPGFEISALSCHANYVTDDFIYSVQERMLRCAHQYGTDIVIMSTFVPFEERENNAERLYEQLVVKTRSLCDIAEKEGVRIAIEVEPNQLFRSLGVFFDVVKAVNSSALKLNFDIGHIFLSELDVGEAIKQSKDYIVHAHIDNMCRGEHCHKLPWDGEIDLVDACQKLKDNGFDGTMALDLYLHDYAAVSAQCVSYIKEQVFSKLK